MKIMGENITGKNIITMGKFLEIMGNFKTSGKMVVILLFVMKIFGKKRNSKIQ